MLYRSAIDSIVVNGLFTLGGVFIGSIFPIIKDIIALKSNQKIEYIKLHDKDKVDAYKVLFSFIQKLKTVTWPDNAEYYHDFIYECKENMSRLIPNYPYYSAKIVKELSNLESIYNMTIIDVPWIIPPEEKVKKELPKIVEKLNKIIISDFKKWNK